MAVCRFHGSTPAPLPGGTLTLRLPRAALRSSGAPERQLAVSPTSCSLWTGQGNTRGRWMWSQNLAVVVPRPSHPVVMLGGRWTFHRPEGGGSSAQPFKDSTLRRVFSTTTSGGTVETSEQGTSRGSSPTTNDNNRVLLPLQLPPLTNSATQTALDYFNHPYFFKWIEDRIYFKNRLFTLDDDEQKILTVTLDEYFRHALEIENTKGGKELYSYFTLSIIACIVNAVQEAYEEWKEQHGIGTNATRLSDPPRISNMDFQITNSTLSHTHDLDCFTTRVNHVIECHENKIERRKYVAPYFCFVQSSGMGKTKLLFEYHKIKRTRLHPIASFLIFPPVEKGQERLDTKVNSYTLDLSNLEYTIPSDSKSPAQAAAQKIFAALDTMLQHLIH
jgi:hypothetical protein